MGDGAGLRISVLGPFRLTVAGDDIPVAGAKRRAVLAILAMSAPRAVGVERLVDAVWPNSAPASGRAALQSHMSRLRRTLGHLATRLSHADGAYRLLLDDGELDAAEFLALVQDGRVLAASDPVSAAERLAAACAMWRGDALDEFGDVEPLAAWRRTLTESWSEASELLATCQLERGDPARALAAADAVLHDDPLREPAVLLVMRALAAQRRTAEALRAGHAFRQRLREETGLDASPALATLEAQIASGSTVPGPDAHERSPTDVARLISAPPGELFGRDAELAGVERLVDRERLVTIVGPGGVGKTRLALEVVGRAGADIAATVVELATVTDAEALPHVLARALGLDAGQGDLLQRAVASLRRGRQLLVLDNCEHVLDAACRLVTTLLTGCPDLTVLATSRERLGLGVEQTVLLAPLPMPNSRDASTLEAVPSVALFLDRARRVRGGFDPSPQELDTVARIVRALDGLPLAIELAAGRLASLGVTDLEARLDRALDVLGRTGTGATDDRHRTLRAAVEWSYDLLDPESRRLFRHFSVFPGGFDLATAESVARELGTSSDPAFAVGHLVDASMVVAELDGRPRYRMLDTLRSFGLQQLEAESEYGAAEERLLRWAVDLATEIDAAYCSDAETAADRRVRAELANLRTAWRTARNAGEIDAAAAIAVGLYTFAAWREITELFTWSLELAGDPALSGHPREAQVLAVAAEATWSSTGDLPAAEALARRAVAAVRPGDDLGFALATWSLADVLLFQGHYRQAMDLAVRAREGTPWLAEGHGQAALACTYGRDFEQARKVLAEMSRLVSGPTLTAYFHYVTAELANFEGDFAAAEAAYRAAIELAEEVGATFIVGIASVGLVTALGSSGDSAAALTGYRRLVERWERAGAWTQQWTTLRNLADLLERLGDDATAGTIRFAAEHAPEAASLGAAGASQPPPEEADACPLAREQVLVVAREAIHRAEQGLAVTHR